MVLLGLAVIAFFSTKIDDLFFLLIFFGDRRFRAREIVAGEYAGIAVLYGVSVVCSMTSLVIPRQYIGLLGLVPVAIGAKKLLDLRRSRRETKKKQTQPYRRGFVRRAFSVAAITIANGGDNIGVYTPLFVTRPLHEIAIIGLVFVAMTALWCLMAGWLVKHPALGPSLSRYSHRIVPFILMGLGLLILFEAGSFSMLAAKI